VEQNHDQNGIIFPLPITPFEVHLLPVNLKQDAVGQGGTAVATALKLIRGEPYEKEVFIPFQLVTKENVGRYLKQ
jgi:prolyl-tRNA synthetase